jgi:hypothetical protein
MLRQLLARVLRHVEASEEALGRRADVGQLSADMLLQLQAESPIETHSEGGQCFRSVGEQFVVSTAEHYFDSQRIADRS